MAKTLQQRYIEALSREGYQLCETLSRKSVTLVHPDRCEAFYYVGNGGSLRVGATKALSIPVSQRFKDRLLTK